MGRDGLRSKRHNPPLERDQVLRLDDIKWERRCTWKEFYAWAIPLIEEEHRRSPPQAGR